MTDGDFAETHKDCPEVIGVLLVLVEDCDGDFEEVGIGTDGEARVCFHHGSVERVYELSETEFEVPHNYFQQFDHALDLRVFVIMDVAGITDGIEYEGEGMAGEADDDIDVGRIVGDYFQEGFHDGHEGVHEFLAADAVFSSLLQFGEDIGQDGW